MNAATRTAYAAVIEEAMRKAAEYGRQRAALDPRSRTFPRDNAYLTHLIEAHLAKADRHRAIAEAKEQG